MGRSRNQPKPTRPALKLSPRAREAVLALANGASVEEAATRARATLDEVLYWLSDGRGERMIAALRATRRAALQARLEAAASEALTTLRTVMSDDGAPHQAKVTAAATLLRSALADDGAHNTITFLDFENVEVEEEAVIATNGAAA